ncbi:MAG: hypothetical protein ACJ72D_11810 [Marmoricola sp.]
MRSALADPAPGRPDRSRRPHRAVTLGALLLTTALLLVGCSGNTSIPPPVASKDTSDARTSAAASTLDALTSALATGDGSAAAGLGIAGSRDLLRSAAANVTALHLVDLSLRFVDDGSPTAADDSAFGPDSWQATVEVGYRIRDWDTGRTRLETTFTFVPTTAGQVVAAIGGSSGRTPLWLSGPVTPLVAGRTLVVARSASGPRYSRLATRAVVAVDKVLPSWKGKLVIEAPSTEDELDHALGTTQEQYANIAAVTATVDGSLVRTAPVHVFLNPRVFDALGPRGSQVVISHESTHVATKATFASMPTWLLEGFADYVALAHAGIPVGTAASQILAKVRRSGPPTALPTTADLDPTANGLGATYEEAWLANRFIARQFSEKKLVQFYGAVDRGATATAAFRSVLHTTEQAFVKSWSADVKALSRGVAG